LRQLGPGVVQRADAVEDVEVELILGVRECLGEQVVLAAEVVQDEACAGLGGRGDVGDARVADAPLGDGHGGRTQDLLPPPVVLRGPRRHRRSTA